MLLRVKAAGVCLSDVHLIEGLIDSPLRTALEVAGEVEALGEDVDSWRRGDRVVISGAKTVQGRDLGFGIDIDGGWAEYIVVPAAALTAIPDSISVEHAAIVLMRSQRHRKQSRALPGSDQQSPSVSGARVDSVCMQSSCCHCAARSRLSSSTPASPLGHGHWWPVPMPRSIHAIRQSRSQSNTSRAAAG